MRQFYFGLGYLLRSFYCFGGWIEGNANEFSLDIWAFCRPKTPPTRLGGVSYHWAVGPDGAWVWRLAELVRIPRNGTWQSHWLGGRRRHVIAHVGGVAVEETLLALVSGLAGRRTRAQWCWMTMTWV
jgi:hypothetical protein